jgi:hypothetical protein
MKIQRKGERNNIYAKYEALDPLGNAIGGDNCKLYFGSKPI